MNTDCKNPTGWIARNKDKSLFLFWGNSKPEYDEIHKCWTNDIGLPLVLDSSFFPEISFDKSPQKVELVLNLDTATSSTGLKPFDKVLVRDFIFNRWTIDFFVRYDSCSIIGRYLCKIGGHYRYCVPYNAKTAHLLNTTDRSDLQDT